MKNTYSWNTYIIFILVLLGVYVCYSNTEGFGPGMNLGTPSDIHDFNIASSPVSVSSYISEVCNGGMCEVDTLREITGIVDINKLNRIEQASEYYPSNTTIETIVDDIDMADQLINLLSNVLEGHASQPIVSSDGAGGASGASGDPSGDPGGDPSGDPGGVSGASGNEDTFAILEYNSQTSVSSSSGNPAGGGISETTPTMFSGYNVQEFTEELDDSISYVTLSSQNLSGAPGSAMMLSEYSDIYSGDLYTSFGSVGMPLQFFSGNVLDAPQSTRT